MAEAQGKMNIEICADDVRRLKAAAKILAHGAIRVAALSSHKPDTKSSKPSPSTKPCNSDGLLDCDQPIASNQPINKRHKTTRVERDRKDSL